MSVLAQTDPSSDYRVETKWLTTETIPLCVDKRIREGIVTLYRVLKIVSDTLPAYNDLFQTYADDLMVIELRV